MASKTRKPKRAHPGLCLDLLDEEHKLLIREMAGLLWQIRERYTRKNECSALGRWSAQCVLCGERSEELSTYDHEQLYALPISHRPDCVAMHATRIIGSDRPLELLAVAELSAPKTAVGRSHREEYERHREARQQRTKETPLEVVP